MQKYTMKAETFSPPSDAHIKSMGVKPDASVHGSDGPIQTGYPGFIYGQWHRDRADRERSRSCVGGDGLI